MARGELDTVSVPINREKKLDVTSHWTGVFSQEILNLQSAAAKRHCVEPAIHPADFMYWFHVANSCHPSVAIDCYFDDGALSARKLATMSRSNGLCDEHRVKLLEFASGYGMVTRHLKRYPQLDVVCADIHKEAIDFLSSTLFAKAIMSHSKPEEFRPEERFDITFALSFFTHMPRSSFGRWLGALYQTLNPGGRLLFTTHGYATLADHPQFEMPPDGFLFVPMSEQKDLEVAEYGTTIVKPELVMGLIIEHAEHASTRQIVYRHAYWWKRQDLWIVTRV